jgi:hypothetical protein
MEDKAVERGPAIMRIDELLSVKLGTGIGGGALFVAVAVTVQLIVRADLRILRTCQQSSYRGRYGEIA